MDAAILFSDILIPVEAMGVELAFEEGEGPKLTPVRKSGTWPGSTCPTPSRRRASSWTPCGSSGGNSIPGSPHRVLGRPLHARLLRRGGGRLKNFRYTLAWMYEDPEGFQALMDLLAETVIAYCSAQVEAGVQAIQLFDTWAGVLSRRLYREFALPATQKVVQALRRFDVPAHPLRERQRALPGRDGGRGC